MSGCNNFEVKILEFLESKFWNLRRSSSSSQACEIVTFPLHYCLSSLTVDLNFTHSAESDY